MPDTAPQALKWFEDPQVLRAKRKRLGLTQADLAKLSKVKHAIIANIEAGRRTLSGEIAKSLWDALDKVSYQRRKELAGVATLSDMNPPKDPKAFEAWKASMAKRLTETKAAMARQFGSYANFQEIVEQVVARERQIAALQAEVAAQAEQISALRDLLDIKTREVLLRDQIESAPTSTEPEKKTDG